jgi:hypothetical protein
MRRHPRTGHLHQDPIGWERAANYRPLIGVATYNFLVGASAGAFRHLSALETAQIRHF